MRWPTCSLTQLTWVTIKTRTFPRLREQNLPFSFQQDFLGLGRFSPEVLALNYKIHVLGSGGSNLFRGECIDNTCI